MSSNLHDEMAKFQSLWDSALERMDLSSDDNVSPDVDDGDSKPPVDPSSVELIQERQRASSNKPLDINDMLLLSNNIEDYFKPNQCNEGELDKKEMGHIATKQAASPNPVRSGTAGEPDQELEVTPSLNDSKALRELDDVKKRLESLEREVHGAMVSGDEKKENKLKQEVSSLRSKVEELSNELIPHNLKASDA